MYINTSAVIILLHINMVTCIFICLSIVIPMISLCDYSELIVTGVSLHGVIIVITIIDGDVLYIHVHVHVCTVHGPYVVWYSSLGLPVTDSIYMCILYMYMYSILFVYCILVRIAPNIQA